MRLQRLAILAGVLVLLGGVISGQSSRSAAAQAELRAAMDKAGVEGDLAGAIQRYRAIVEKYSKTDRTTAATALMEMAGCYRKIGDRQARAAYERVVREFGDVGSIASAARARLSELDNQSRMPATSTLALRRIYDGPGLDWCNGLSSDARYLSHVDWYSGDIAIADLKTRAVRHATKTGSLHRPGSEFGECSVFSPDDRELVFFWQARKDATELRIASVDGSKVRTLYRDTHYLRPLDWSDDGRQILLHIADPANHKLAIVNVADGAVRILKALGPNDVVGRFSPDGRRVAFSSPRTDSQSRKGDLFVIATTGTEEAELIAHPADDRVLGWAPDGRRVFFASDRTGSNGVWSIGLDNGRPSGEPVLVKAGVGSLTPIRLLRGTLYYMTRSDMSDVYVGGVDLEKGILQSPGVPATAYSPTANFAPDWSPDGKFLAYRSMPGAADQWARPAAMLSIVEVETGQTRSVRPSVESFDPNDGPRWSPDGKSVLVIGMQGTPQHGVYKVDVATGATTPLVKVPPGQWLLHALWSRDGRHIFYSTGNPTRIVKRDLDSGSEQDLVRLKGPGGSVRIALSPDGRRLAFTSVEPAEKPVRALNVVSTDGGETRPIHRTGEHEGVGWFAWTPGQRYIYFRNVRFPGAGAAMPGEAPPAVDMWRVRPEGGAPEKVQMDIPGPSFAFSPDGRRVAFGKGKSTTELWALENLVTPARKGS